ncbi:hypothetical protein GQX74_001758 [Glossina fuscipes]|nr:hypothetical protein GQX74_001758 [Glossina fuscipes]
MNIHVTSTKLVHRNASEQWDEETKNNVLDEYWRACLLVTRIKENTEITPKGLEDVSSYPTLFAELLGAGWSIEDLTKLAGGNFLRVLQQVEKIRDEKRAANVKPYEDHPNFRAEDPYNCTSS